jgi:purine-binding chemotaxis protein CheW
MEMDSTSRGNGGQPLVATVHAPLTVQNEADPEMLARIWAERAARLAEVPVEADTGEQITLLLVRLGRELYGLDTQHVNRIEPVDVGHITRVPRVPDWVAGVTNLRGRVLSVVDVGRFFGLSSVLGHPERASGNGTDDRARPQEEDEFMLVVVEALDMELALLVDSVLSVETIPVRQIREATNTVRSSRPEYVRGVTRHGKESSPTLEGDEALIVVLDLPTLLADERLIIHKEIV